jgi:hypothetical protein
MAARKNRPNHDEKTRQKIQTSQLINRLQDHGLGKIEIEKTQIDAIKILLNKTLPDLSAIALTDMPDEKVKQVFGWLPVQK